MKLIESLRLAEASNYKFTIQPTESGATGVFQVNAPLTEQNSEILGIKPGPFGKGTMRDHVDACMLEFPSGADVFGIEADYIHKPVIVEVEAGGFQIELKCHVAEAALFRLLEFMCTKKKADYHLIVRPLERTLLDGRDEQSEPEAAGAFTPPPAETAEQPGLGLTCQNKQEYATKKAAAQITIGDVDGGSAAEWTAEFKFRNERSSGLRSTEPVASEREALELAAGAVHAFAGDVFQHAGSTAEKKEAHGMMQWAEQWMSREQLTGASDDGIADAVVETAADFIESDEMPIQ